MKQLFGAITVVIGLLYLGQLVSVLNLTLAQKLGLQEDPAATDPLAIRLEVWTARWDLVWLWVLPAAGVLMLIDHPWWPFLALIGGGTCIDTGGREAAKSLGLREQGIKIGTRNEQRLIMVTFSILILIGGLAIVAALLELI